MSLPKLNLTLRQFWGLFLLFLFSFSLPLTVFLATQKQELRKKAEEISSVVCNGNNDQIKINAAINTLPVEGGTVTLPATQCNLSGSIVISKSNVTLQGQGITTVLFLADNTNRDVITASNRSNLHIRNLTINGNKTHQTSQIGIGIKFNQVAKSSIEGVIVKETGWHGIRIENSAEAPEFVIRNTQTINTGMMGIVVAGVPRDITIINNTTLNTDNVGIFVRINGLAQRIRIEGNTVQNPKGPGIHISGESGSLDEIWIIGNTVSGMHDTDTAFGIWIPGIANQTSIKHIINNKVLANGPGVTGGDHFGLRGNNGVLTGNYAEGSVHDGFALGSATLGLTESNWTIKDNRAINNGGDGGQGFMLWGIRNSVVAGNIVSGNSQDGIRLGQALNNQVENNTVYNNGWVGIIEMGRQSDYNQISCNNVYDNGGEQIVTVGPHTRIIPYPCLTPTPKLTPTPTPRPTATLTLTPTPTPIPTRPPLIGDIDRDGDVDIFDYNILVSHFGPRMPPGGSPADLDHDGDVDIFDYNLLVSNFGRRI